MPVTPTLCNFRSSWRDFEAVHLWECFLWNQHAVLWCVSEVCCNTPCQNAELPFLRRRVTAVTTVVIECVPYVQFQVVQKMLSFWLWRRVAFDIYSIPAFRKKLLNSEASAKLRKSTVSPSETTLVPMDGFTKKRSLNIFRKSVEKIQVLLKCYMFSV